MEDFKDTVLTVSTAHLTPAEYKELEASPTTARYSYGLVWDRIIDGLVSFGPRFANNVDGARFIRFDRDASTLAHMDTYRKEWE